MGGSQQKSTSSTKSANPMVDKTVNKLLGGVQSEYDKGASTFGKSLFAGAGDTTQAAWESSLAAGNNADFTSGLGGAMSHYGKEASGEFLNGNDPYFQRNLERTLGDTKADVNTAFGADGRYGSNFHVGTMVDSLGGVRDRAYSTELDQSRDRMAQATQMMPGIYSALQLPSATMGAVGSAQDANSQGMLQGENDLFLRNRDARIDQIGKLTSAMSGNAAAAGTTTTQTQPSTPWWMTGLGIGLGLV